MPRVSSRPSALASFAICNTCTLTEHIQRTCDRVKARVPVACARLQRCTTFGPGCKQQYYRHPMRPSTRGWPFRSSPSVAACARHQASAQPRVRSRRLAKTLLQQKWLCKGHKVIGCSLLPQVDCYKWPCRAALVELLDACGQFSYLER